MNTDNRTETAEAKHTERKPNQLLGLNKSTIIGSIMLGTNTLKIDPNTHFKYTHLDIFIAVQVITIRHI